MRRAALAAAALIAAPPAPPQAPVSYTIAPVIEGGALRSVAVMVRFTGEAGGRTVVDLPDRFAGTTGLWRYVGGVRVEGATIAEAAPGPKLTLTHAPSAPITLRYRVESAYTDDPLAGPNPYDGAIIRPTWMSALGEELFAAPEGHDLTPVRVRWNGWPAAWKIVSDLDHAQPGRAITLDDLIESTVLAGPDVTLRTLPITGGTLRFATRGTWTLDMDAYARVMTRTITAERGFWGDVTGPFTVTLMPEVAKGGGTSVGGTGRSNGFALYASTDSNADTLLAIIAHEHTHIWVPRRIGEMSEADERADYWLSEGFTDFYASRVLLRTGLWTRQQFIADLNGKLLAYAASPARAYPNSRIVAAFWTDPAVQKLPYRRGELFAYTLDHRLRARGGLDPVMFAMRDRWAAAPPGHKPPLIANLLAAVDAAGLEIRPLIARHIEAGEPIALPPDLFAGCASIATTIIPAFDPGFDREASLKAGVFTSVDPRGPAYAAGLRDGMKRLARVSGTQGDSRAQMAYRVADSTGERVIGWRPEGKARIMLQEVTMILQPTPAAEARCTRAIGGAAA